MGRGTGGVIQLRFLVEDGEDAAYFRWRAERSYRPAELPDSRAFTVVSLRVSGVSSHPLLM
jgi:hypothetical protein